MQTAERSLGEAIRQRDVFAATTVHDLLNPVAAVQLLADLLRTADLPAAERRRVELLDASVTRIASILDTLRHFGDIREGGLRLRPDRTDLLALAHSCAEAVSVLAEPRQVRVEVAADGPVSGDVDAQVVRRVMDNLLAFALKRAPRGSRVVLQLTQDPSGMTRIAVTDTGERLADAAVEAFAAGVRPATALRAANERGLPLTFAQLAAQAMGGTLSVTGGLRGATVALELPAAEMARTRLAS
ncbi:MAG: HAMP domain-containing histidine kinase [Gemmatimonadaceae bacterium]|nr:HAMP domain-containing histidine kinase [Gemmatimonadaceae bacterium]